MMIWFIWSRFYSTLVRLKEYQILPIHLQKLTFLFHIGAIKRDQRTVLVICAKKFLFHIGAIKSPTNAFGKNTGISFLFHIGAIKRQTRWIVKKRICVFLFHIGAIKRKSTWRRWRGNGCFYSTLVRLKGDDLRRHQVGHVAFLFHIGAIKRCFNLHYANEDEYMFLFHIGAIKRYLVFPALVQPQCFYSTLVRLKGKKLKNIEKSTLFVSIPHWCD